MDFLFLLILIPFSIIKELLKFIIVHILCLLSLYFIIIFLIKGVSQESIETLNKTYTTFYKETVQVKYLKLIPYFLPIEEAKQRIKNLVNTLIRILTIMSPTFVVPLNINTNRY
ncbi:hypothetical protein [Spiroplasma poulsonii]|uniref:hypothetical protein n=1 Tax=Spiroplasma poulsonii TaxID=2138 RepID=UPI001F4CAC54|nr:hypothetical protein [Spiroplasma poulsonii]UNF61301.1 hypothetical protein MNU24_05135 [Spiroplasma poulsonii]